MAYANADRTPVEEPKPEKRTRHLSESTSIWKKIITARSGWAGHSPALFPQPPKDLVKQ
jgi:hypothetical protein